MDSCVPSFIQGAGGLHNLLRHQSYILLGRVINGHASDYTVMPLLKREMIVCWYYHKVAAARC
jgi:hypothetical protein